MRHCKRPQSTLMPTKAFNQCEFRFATHTKTGDERPKEGVDNKKIQFYDENLQLTSKTGTSYSWHSACGKCNATKTEQPATSTQHTTHTKNKIVMERIQTIIIIKTKALRAEEGWRKWLNRSTFIFVYYRLHILQTSERMKARHRMRVCHMLSILTCKAFKFIIQILSPFFVRLLSLSPSLCRTLHPLFLSLFLFCFLFSLTDWHASFTSMCMFIFASCISFHFDRNISRIPLFFQ